MTIKEDRTEFEKRQAKLIQEIASSFKSRLAEMGLGDDRELLEGLVWDVVAILDGSREMKLDGKFLLPFLTFTDARGGEYLVAAQGGSWMHEVCSGVLKEMFGDVPSA
jgi:hypothetical protein